MKKKDIFKKLDELELDKDKYIIIGGAALVCYGIKSETSDIDLSCSIEYYDSILWDTKIGLFNTEIKYRDIFEIGTDFYYSNYNDINGYRFISLEDLLELVKLEKKKNMNTYIRKLNILIDSCDPFKNEKELYDLGYKYIAGIDEVGRGPLVGPVVAACVILPREFDLDGLTDSKKLSEKKRNYYYDKIMECAISVGVGVISNEVIDDVNIYEATKMAMIGAINNCSIKPDYLLIDAMKLDVDIPQRNIIKGDLLSISISAASVIAKVYRDRLMYDLDSEYPEYNFKSNKGYGTKDHIDALYKFGYLKEHRKSFKPVYLTFPRKNK